MLSFQILPSLANTEMPSEYCDVAFSVYKAVY